MCDRSETLLNGMLIRIPLLLVITFSCGKGDTSLKESDILDEDAQAETDILGIQEGSGLGEEVGQNESNELDKVEFSEDPKEVEAPEGEASTDKDAGSDGGLACSPGEVVCVGGARFECTIDGCFEAKPCPPGTVCVDSACVPNVTRVYLVVDTTLGVPTGDMVSADLFCRALREAISAGSWCPDPLAQLTAPPCICDEDKESPKNVCTVFQFYPLVVSFLVRKVLQGLSDIPNLQVVLLHPPSRTAKFTLDPSSDKSLLCTTGFYQPAFAEDLTYPLGHCAVSPTHPYDECLAAYKPLLEWMCGEDGCQCSDGPIGIPPVDLLETMFSYSVVNYPEPWTAKVSDLLQWVDGTEEIAETGEPCSDSSECHGGVCSNGRCWKHIDPEIRALSQGHYGFGTPATPLLYLASQFIRLHGSADGRACETSQDCKPFGAECRDGVCVEEALPCVPQHVIFFTPLHEQNLPIEVNVARWMRTGLVCESNETCFGTECLTPPSDEPLCLGSLPEGTKECSPLEGPTIEGWLGNSLEPTKWGSDELLISEPIFATTSGVPIHVTTHVVMTTADVTLYGLPIEGWVQPLAVAIAGGGKLVVPLHRDFFEFQNGDLLGISAFLDNWEEQLEALIEAIRLDAAQHVCLPDEIPQELIPTLCQPSL